MHDRAPGPCAAGAVAAGGTHFMSTAKKLTEEGVDPAARVRAMPLAVSAVRFACWIRCCWHKRSGS